MQSPWEFVKGKRPIKITPTGPLSAVHPALQLQAAIDGLGFYMTTEGLCACRDRVGASRNAARRLVTDRPTSVPVRPRGDDSDRPA